MSKATNYLLFGVIVMWALIWAWGATSASPERVGAMIEKAEKSTDAKLAITVFMKSNPSPSNSEVHDMEQEVSEFLVRDLARKQTGDNTIKTKSEIATEQAQKNDAEMQKPIYSIFGKTFSLSNIVSYTFLIFIGIIMFVVVPFRVFNSNR
jgi:hypothetical protein